MRQKILLINPRYKSRDIAYFPLGLGYVAGACDKQGIEVECIDLNMLDVNGQWILDKIRREGFYIVGIGGFITQLRSTIELCNLIKREFKDIVVIIGGIQVFGCGKFIMDHSMADIACMGESEIILPKIVQNLYRDKDFSDISSIIYRQNGQIVNKEGFSIVVDLNGLSFPKYDAFQVEYYIKNNYHNILNRRTMDFICSRGCPYECNYCINSGRPIRVRYRSPDNIVKEIQFLKERYNINDLSFGDEIFTINKKKAFEICEALKGLKITWLTSVRADGVDEEILLAMKKAGCRMLLIGFESGSERILRSMDKRINVKKYFDTIKLLRKHDIPFYSNFMIGMPQETEETVRETEEFCKDNGLIFGAAYVTPFPGTKLYEDVKHKIEDEKKYLYKLGDLNFAKEPIINLTTMSIRKLVFVRNRTVVNTMVYLIKRRLDFIPICLLKILCKSYLFVFGIKNVFVSKLLRPFNKIIYSTFSK